MLSMDEGGYEQRRVRATVNSISPCANFVALQQILQLIFHHGSSISECSTNVSNNYTHAGEVFECFSLRATEREVLNYDKTFTDSGTFVNSGIGCVLNKVGLIKAEFH